MRLATADESSYVLDLYYSLKYRFLDINRPNSVVRGLASTPLFIIPDFSLHFPLELSYGYPWFEGSGKIPLGRQGKTNLTCLMFWKLFWCVSH